MHNNMNGGNAGDKHAPHSDHLSAFRDAMAGAGFIPPDDLSDDGKLHRFNPTGQRGDNAGWYVLHGDGVPAGTFGNWRDDHTQNWCGKPDTSLTEAERAANLKRIAQVQAEREADTAQRHQLAAESARTLWMGATPATASHPYLVRKGIQAHGAKISGDGLLIPLRDTTGTLHSLQAIAPSGEKRFHAGGRVKGCYFAIGKPTGGKLIVCEGFATGASLHEATGQAVAIAFNAGNLIDVATALRAKYPRLSITIAADDDWKTTDNPGLSKATMAAQAVKGLLAVPTFTAGRGDKDTDFNDLHQISGLDAVHAAIEAAQSPATTTYRGQTFPPLPNDVAALWPEPQPLPDALPPVTAFDFELLPEALRGWVVDIAHRMQCPPDFVAVAAVVALSSLIGARAVVAPKMRNDWRVTPNLWGLIVGRPGVMKSPALGEVLKLLHRLEATEREQWQFAHESWQLDCKVAGMTAEANERTAKGLAAKDPAKARALLQPEPLPTEPTARRYIVNDATVEKLGELLAVNPWGTLAYRDELYGLLTSMDKQGQEGSRAFYLQAYDGDQGYTFDRIGRGTVHIPRVCLSLLGGIQPGRIEDYVRSALSGGAGDDGLLQRFGLAVWPDIARDYVYVDQYPNAPAKEAARAVFDRLAQLQPANDAQPQEWHFSPAAQAVYVEWVIPFETEIRGDELHPALVSHLSKYRKLIPALALIFALVDTPDSGNIIHEAELLRALAWGDYLRTHAERIYTVAMTPQIGAARALLDKIKAGKLPDDFKLKDVQQKGWTGLSTTDDVRKAADYLCDFDWLQCDVVQSGDAMGRGRPSVTYRIHPSLKVGEK